MMSPLQTQRNQSSDISRSQISKNGTFSWAQWLSFFTITGFIPLLTSCGYRWEIEKERPTIEVPYVSGDGDGSLTAEIVRALAVSGIGEVRQWGARYRLQVAIARSEGETIGYRRDRQKVSGESQKNLVASEKRKTMSVETALYENATNQVICGPFRIDAFIDFDYVDGDSIQDLVFIGPNGVRQVVLPFSLGQLESIEAAEEAAMRPLNVELAHKIIDTIFVDRY